MHTNIRLFTALIVRSLTTLLEELFDLSALVNLTLRGMLVRHAAALAPTETPPKVYESQELSFTPWSPQYHLVGVGDGRRKAVSPRCLRAALPHASGQRLHGCGGPGVLVVPRWLNQECAGESAA
jgi:hypothetical protein